ncbi:MAG TPA: hypothetical protein VII13_16555 [Vicinamibacteria bacterium]
MLGAAARELVPGRSAAPPPGMPRDQYWDDCRNSLGIARLLVQDGRPEALITTACRMAVESACRAALEQAGLPFTGDMNEGLRRLGCFDAVGAVEVDGPARARLAAAEKAVSWVAVYLRGVAPERPWGY